MLPFAKRWIQMPQFKINIALNELFNLGTLHAYAPLVEKDKGLVSQAEHSVIVRDKPVITTKID
jgi:methionyl aminopeptidase